MFFLAHSTNETRILLPMQGPRDTAASVLNEFTEICMTHDHSTIATGEDTGTGNTNPGPSSPQKCQWHGSGKPELPLASFSVLLLLLRQIRNHKPELPLTEGCGLEETELAEV